MKDSFTKVLRFALIWWKTWQPFYLFLLSIIQQCVFKCWKLHTRCALILLHSRKGTASWHFIYNLHTTWSHFIEKVTRKYYICIVIQLMLILEDFEDTKGVIRIRKSKKYRQHNGQKKKDQQRSTKHTHKAKDRVTRTPLKTGGWTQVLWKE